MGKLFPVQLQSICKILKEEKRLVVITRLESQLVCIQDQLQKGVHMLNNSPRYPR